MEGLRKVAVVVGGIIAFGLIGYLGMICFQRLYKWLGWFGF